MWQCIRCCKINAALNPFSQPPPTPLHYQTYSGGEDNNRSFEILSTKIRQYWLTRSRRKAAVWLQELGTHESSGKPKSRKNPKVAPPPKKKCVYDLLDEPLLKCTCIQTERDEGFTSLVRDTVVVVQLIICFVKTIPGFTELSQRDQITLLKATTSDLMILRTAAR